MYTTKTNYKIISYNVMSSQNMAGLLTILDLEKPDLVLLQENVLNSEHLTTFLSSARGYKVASNVDESDIRKPGTAIVWKDDLPVTNVVAMEPNRLQVAYIGPYPIVNIYPPAGSNNGPARRELFREGLFRVMRGLGGKLPILGGDWNCVINVRDIEAGNYGSKRSRDLADLVREFNMTDCFRNRGW